MLSLNALSLKSKLIVPLILFSLVILLLTQGNALNVALKSQTDNLIDRAHVLSLGLSSPLNSAILGGHTEQATQILQSFSADKEIVRVKLHTLDGKLFSIYEQHGVAAPLPSAQQLASLRETGQAVSDDYLFALFPLYANGNEVAKFRVTISTKSFQDSSEQVIHNALIFIVFLTIATAILFYTVQKYILNPVISLRAAIQGYIEHKSNSIEIDTIANDEVGDLVRAFRTMLRRLKLRDQQVNHTLDRLEQEKSFANEVVESVKHALIVVNQHGDVLHFNAMTCEIFRCTSAFIQASKLTDLIQGKGQFELTHALEHNLEFEDRHIVLEDLFHERRFLKVSGTPLSKPGQCLIAIEDITQVEVAMSRQRMAANIFENSKDGLVVTDDSDVVTMLNPASRRILGVDSSDIIGQHHRELFRWADFDTVMAQIKCTIEEQGEWQGEVWEIHPLGHRVPLYVRASKNRTSASEHRFDYVYVIVDLSSVKEMERLEYMVNHDSLTGLANRTHLYRVLGKTLTDERLSKTGIALLYLDLDGFKAVNDTYGHDAGDAVLKEVSRRLSLHVRSQDLVARLSGDEFVVLMTSCDQPSTHALAERLLAEISNEIDYAGERLSVGVSIGIHYTQRAQGTSLEQFLKEADKAMYRAKMEGKGQVIMSEAS
ncbi:diguanylate cyclase [Vibrio cholerae]